jgi:lipopolysaccharide/colanic/teichoic acid biosynthesis glycosyltransferase
VIRLLDIFFSFIGLLILSPLIILLAIIGFFENGSPIFIQQRVGYNEKIFFLIKFRTMKKNTKTAATHLIDNNMITSFGYFLRRTKLDELPQLLNVLIGDMSIIGPRPCLPNQNKLINERKKRGVFKVKPGITGLAQVSGIDMKTPTILAKTDLEMIEHFNLYNYFYYIFKTFSMVLSRKDI